MWQFGEFVFQRNFSVSSKLSHFWHNFFVLFFIFLMPAGFVVILPLSFLILAIYVFAQFAHDSRKRFSNFTDFFQWTKVFIYFSLFCILFILLWFFFLLTLHLIWPSFLSTEDENTSLILNNPFFQYKHSEL